MADVLGCKAMISEIIIKCKALKPSCLACMFD